MAPESTLTRKLDKEIATLAKRSKVNRKFFTSVKDISYTDFLSNRLAMILVIREGVPYSLFNLIRNYAPFTENDWATILDISTKSLHRYRQTVGGSSPFNRKK